MRLILSQNEGLIARQVFSNTEKRGILISARDGSFVISRNVREREK